MVFKVITTFFQIAVTIFTHKLRVYNIDLNSAELTEFVIHVHLVHEKVQNELLALSDLITLLLQVNHYYTGTLIINLEYSYFYINNM